MATLSVALYGIYISSEHMHQEVWMMIFPIAFAPIVIARERIFWLISGVASFALIALQRPESLTALSICVFATAYLTLGFVTLMLVRHNEQNIERLAQLSIIDSLTKAYNRGYLKDVMVS